MKFIILSCIALACVSGCAANPGLQAQAPCPAPERRGGEADAKAFAADSYHLAQDAWDWVSTTVGDAYHNSAMVNCYKKDSDSVHTIDDAKALAMRCWNDN